jgi:hypothetical protein
MRQGTTSVVPQMAQTVSGFSRCGTVNNLKQMYAGVKAQQFLV